MHEHSPAIIDAALEEVRKEALGKFNYLKYMHEHSPAIIDAALEPVREKAREKSYAVYEEVHAEAFAEAYEKELVAVAGEGAIDAE